MLTGPDTGIQEELGTLPSVYYLPPTQRMFPVESGLEDI